MQTVILAGGKGIRLRPYTLCIPKPLIPIDDIPILELIIKQLKHYGFSDMILSLNYLSDLIMAFFKNGEKQGVTIRYSIEEEYLGTAGPLSIIGGLEDIFLVMNSDILTNINYADLMKYHMENGNDATIAIYRKEIEIDLGVVQTEKGELINFVEKPSYYYDVCMGIYVLNKCVIDLIPNNKRMDFPELISKMKQSNKKVGCYEGNHLWLDIGRFPDYEKAVLAYREKRGEFLPHE
jgi:NDP-mannose synthase